MTENKRFKLHIKWYNIEKTEGEATLTDYGQPLIETEQITDARLLKNILNDLYNENEQLKQFQEQVAEVIESKMGDNVCNDYKMEVLKEIWNKLNLDEVWFK